jgi:outer membrane protein assembly factor BamB
MEPTNQPITATAVELDNLVYVGFNSKVVALDRASGELAWTWKSPKGSGFVALLLDGDRLIASVQGYTYCLDPLSGEQLWHNPLKGMGVGLPCLASARGNTTAQLFAVLAEAERQREAQSHAATT